MDLIKILVTYFKHFEVIHKFVLKSKCTLFAGSTVAVVQDSFYICGGIFIIDISLWNSRQKFGSQFPW